MLNQSISLKDWAAVSTILNKPTKTFSKSEITMLPSPGKMRLQLPFESATKSDKTHQLAGLVICTPLEQPACLTHLTHLRNIQRAHLQLGNSRVLTATLLKITVTFLTVRNLSGTLMLMVRFRLPGGGAVGLNYPPRQRS